MNKPTVVDSKKCPQFPPILVRNVTLLFLSSRDGVLFCFLTSLNLTLTNSKHDRRRGLKSACALGFVHFLVLEATMQRSWASPLENERPHGERFRQ